MAQDEMRDLPSSRSGTAPMGMHAVAPAGQAVAMDTAPRSVHHTDGAKARAAVSVGSSAGARGRRASPGCVSSRLTIMGSTWLCSSSHSPSKASSSASFLDFVRESNARETARSSDLRVQSGLCETTRKGPGESFGVESGARERSKDTASRSTKPPTIAALHWTAFRAATEPRYWRIAENSKPLDVDPLMTSSPNVTVTEPS